jgi:hypothetical protein
MQVGYKRFNWLPSPTAWQQTVGWRKRRLEAQQRIEQQIQPIVDGLANAQHSQLQGLTTITLQIANARIQKEAAAKTAKLRAEALAQFSKI